MRALRGLTVVVALATMACGSQTSPPAPANPGSPPAGSSPDAPISVAGTEKVGWDQAAGDISQASSYQYSAYVDSVKSVLPDAACQSSGGTSFSCAAKLPQMSAGPHRLEITATSFGFESVKSPAIYLVVAATKAAAGARVAGAAPPAITTSDGVRLAVDTLATGLDLPSALAVTPDGRIFVAQGSGDVHVWQANQILPTPAVKLTDMQRATGVGLVGMTLDTDFATNGRVFAAYVGRARNGALVNRVIRFRELKNVFAEAVVILEDPVGVVAARAPHIRMGRDRKLYIAFPAADWSAADSFASYSGKILRINDDGTTPRDNPRSSPIISAGHAVSGSFDWQPNASRLWLSERDRQGRDVLGYFTAAFDGAAAASFDSALDASGAAFSPPNAQSAFANDLFITGLAGQQLRRVHFNPRDPIRIDSTESLLGGQYGRLSDVIAGPDGALYVATSNRGAASAGPDDDRLLRVTGRR